MPPERRSDADYLLRSSLDMPKKWGPLNGLPRNPKPFLRLLEETSVAAEYEEVGSLSLDQIPSIQTHVLLMYAEGRRSSARTTTCTIISRTPSSMILPRTELGHFGPLEQPEIVAEHLVEFFAVDGLGRRGRR